MGQPEVERLAAAHRQAGEGPVLAVGLDRVVRLDRRDHVLEQVLLERREGRRGGVDVPLGPVVLLGAAVGHDHDHGHGLPLGDQVVEEEIRLGEALPFRLVAADAVQQVEHRVLLLGRVARAACRPASCGSCRPTSSRTRPSPACRAARPSRRRCRTGGSGNAGTSSAFRTIGCRCPGPGRRPTEGACVREQERGELVQAAAPGQPLVRRAGRLVVDVLDPGLLQRLVIVLHALVHALRLGRADAQPEELHLLVELVRVGHHAAVGRLRVERPPPKPPPPPLKPPM